MMNHRMKIIKEIFINPIAVGLAIFTGAMGAIPIFVWVVSLILGLKTDLNNGIMDALSTFIETYRIYFCISPLIVIPLILVEGMYRKTRRFLGEEVTVICNIENNRKADYKVYDRETGKLRPRETSLDFIFTNNENVEINLVASFVSFKHIDKNGIERNILKKVNPNNSNIGWNGNRIFKDIVIGRKGKKSTLNIVRSQYPYNSIKFFEDVWISSDEGRYEFEVAINGKANGIPIEEIRRKDYFVISKRVIEFGEDERIFPDDARLHPDEEPIRGWNTGIELVRFGFATPITKTEFV